MLLEQGYRHIQCRCRQNHLFGLGEESVGGREEVEHGQKRRRANKQEGRMRLKFSTVSKLPNMNKHKLTLFPGLLVGLSRRAGLPAPLALCGTLAATLPIPPD